MVYIRTAYDGHEKAHSDEFSLGGFEPSETQQNFKDECDINNIVNQAIQSGILGDPNRAANLQYGDVYDVPDYQTALNQVIIAQEAFDSLPALARKRFHNSPAEFMEFIHDPDNQAEAIKLGLGTIREEAPKPRSQQAPKDSETPPPAAKPASSKPKKTASSDAE